MKHAKVRRLGRNEPCRCGSGKKWKRCCGRKGTPVTNLYRSLQAVYTPYMRQQERAFVRQWGIVPTPPILAAFCEGEDECVRRWIGRRLMDAGCKPEFIQGILAAGRLSTPENAALWSAEETATYRQILSQFCPPTEPTHESNPVLAGDVPGAAGDADRPDGHAGPDAG